MAQAQQVKWRPIIFTGPMVAAILNGRKTQTRRVIQLDDFGPSDTNGYDYCFRDKRLRWNDITHSQLLARCPYGKPGDKLWVREAWGLYDTEPCDGPEHATLFYRERDGDKHSMRHQLWRPSIFMPRWASRISLEVTRVRIAMLQDITTADAVNEGCVGHMHNRIGPRLGTHVGQREEFARLWDCITSNWRSGRSWADNPWVWVVNFERTDT